MASVLPIPPITIEQYSTFESSGGFRDELINGRIVMSTEPLARRRGRHIYQLVSTTHLGGREEVPSRSTRERRQQHAQPRRLCYRNGGMETSSSAGCLPSRVKGAPAYPRISAFPLCHTRTCLRGRATAGESG